ncbi:unnamed protein product [Prunus armeniaca]|uniref:Uncharacterized protein n=1 Tax=Prunus armeniaca TaxID=36596 RepID=A0A6J5WR08_PRUAR|nr:unnamed protein product [Prunus armeniaca]CAB4300738.1 unnamed protein product [Prunus armeniaca]
MKNVLLKGPMYSMEVFSCIDNMISLKNYGDLVEPHEEQEGVTECPMSQETNENLTKAKEPNGRDFVYLKTQTEPTCVSSSETKLTMWEGYTDFLSEEESE